MPSCNQAYGVGWVGNYPNCTYDPEYASIYTPSFQGSVDYTEEFEGTTLEDDWQKYFDPYDPKEQEMLTKTAGIDVGQLQSAWDLKGKQLGEGWGLKVEELGSKARTGFRQVGREGSTAARKSGLAFSGTIAEMERQKRGEVTGGYKQSLGLGKTAYEQAMETGRLGLQQATTDIYQGLQANIFGLQKDWKQRQRDTLNVLLGSDIYPEEVDQSPPGGFGEGGGYSGLGAGGGLCIWQCPDGCDYQAECPEGLAEGTYFSSTNCCEGIDTDAPCTPEYNLLGQCISCCD